MDQESYGYYGIGVAIVFFISGLITAVYTTQIVISDKSKNDRFRLIYYYRYFKLLVFVFLLVVLAFFVVAFVTLSFWGGYEIIFYFPVLICGVSYAGKEYLTVLCFGADKVNNVFFGQLAFFCVGFVFWVAVYFNYFPISAVLSFLVLAFANLTAVSLMAVLLFREVESASHDKSVAVFSGASFHGGLCHILSNLNSQGYNYFVPLVIGVASVANLNAAKIAIFLSSLLIPPLTQFHRANIIRNPGFSNKYVIQSRRKIIITSILACSPVVIYPLIEKYLFSKYDDLTCLMLIWCLYSILLTYHSVLESEIVLLRRFSLYTSANLFGVAVGGLLIFLLGSVYSEIGVLLSLLIAEVIIIFIYSFKMKYEYSVC